MASTYKLMEIQMRTHIRITLYVRLCIHFKYYTRKYTYTPIYTHNTQLVFSLSFSLIHVVVVLLCESVKLATHQPRTLYRAGYIEYGIKPATSSRSFTYVKTRVDLCMPQICSHRSWQWSGCDSFRHNADGMLSVPIHL